MPLTPLRVFLVEDHPWLLDTLSRVIGMQDDLEVCGTAASAEDALASLPAAVDVLVADYRLPGVNGLDLVVALTERRPEVACIIASAHPAVEVAASARDAGAAAYVEKGDAHALLAAIRACRADP